MRGQSIRAVARSRVESIRAVAAFAQWQHSRSGSIRATAAFEQRQRSSNGSVRATAAFEQRQRSSNGSVRATAAFEQRQRSRNGSVRATAAFEQRQRSSNGSVRATAAFAQWKRSRGGKKDPKYVAACEAFEEQLRSTRISPLHRPDQGAQRGRYDAGRGGPGNRLWTAFYARPFPAILQPKSSQPPERCFMTRPGNLPSASEICPV